mmetsp:Transcript_51095/g.123334  ORF Transcript_51095/g.123334 Transcript_51095/m.123334 type:complete len:361 (+) Transcript_51095:80-1162(+)
MKIGLSLSPGGLLLPYHCGVLHCIQQQQHHQLDLGIVAGSSAGSIAAAAHGCGVPPLKALDATIEISDYCHVNHHNRARGRLLPLLEHHMESLIGEEEFQHLLQSGVSSTKTGVAYHQIFPRRQSHLQCDFVSREDLFKAVSYSCMFPFFTTQWPCLVDWDPIERERDFDYDKDGSDSSIGNNTPRGSERKRRGLKIPHVFVDGYFTEPRERFGCPDLSQLISDRRFESGTAADPGRDDRTQEQEKQEPSQPLVDRTIAVSCLPHKMFNMEDAIDLDDCISPLQRTITNSETNNLPVHGPNKNEALVPYLLRVATTPTSREDLTYVYEMGFQDAEMWFADETRKEKAVETTSWDRAVPTS